VPKKPQQLAKLSRPRLYDALPRERLFRLLDEARHHPGIWVAAPPGAGKTTLVAGYVQERGVPCLWYQVDGGDSDPATFFYFLGLAEQRISGRGRRALPLFTPEYGSELVNFSRRTFRRLFARLEVPSLLVFDNFQELPPRSAVHEAIACAIEEAPAGVSVILLSREEPEGNYLRSFANRSLARIHWNELRLTEREASAILGARLPDAVAIRRLHEQTDGWAAGLILLAEWVNRGGSIEQIGKPDSLQDIFRYFAGEWLVRASEHDQDVLLRLSFLPRIPASAASALSGSVTAGRVLETLYRAHLFVDRRDGPEPVYQFHALFNAFLQHRVEEVFTPSDIGRAAIGAARVLDGLGYPEDAMPLYLRGGDYLSARALVLRESGQLILHGRWQVVVDWITRLPAETVATQHWLKYWLGCAWLAVDPAKAREFLEQAFELAVLALDEMCEAESAAAVIQTYVLQYTRFRPLDPWISVLEKRIRPGATFADEEAELRVLGAFLVASAYRRPGHAQLPWIIDRVFHLVESGISASLRLVAAGYLCAYGVSTGPLNVARRVLPTLMKLLERPEISASSSAWSWFIVSWFHCICGNRQAGLDAVARVERIADEESLPYLRKFSAIIGAWIELYAHNLDLADAWLERLEDVMSPTHLYDMATFHGTRGFLHALRGHADPALADGTKAVEMFDAAGSTMHQMTYRVNLVLPLVQKGMFEEARKVIAEMHRVGQDTSTHWWKSALLAVEAHCCFAAGQRETGLSILEAAFRYGRIHGEDYGFHNWLQHLMPELCATALSENIEADYAKGLIRRHGWLPEVPTDASWPWPIRVRTLGEFRVEIDDKPLSFARKAPRKVLALLKAILAMGGRSVPEQRLMDALWPDEPADSARESLAANLHRLRKLLVHANAIQLSEGLLSVSPRHCWVDAWELERLTAEPPGDGVTASSQSERVLALYAGPFLAEEVDSPWALSARTRIGDRFLRYLIAAARLQEESGLFEAAISLYQRGIDIDELAEPLYQGLMRCYQRIGRNPEGLAIYKRLRRTLSVNLGTRPSAASEALAQSLFRA
jgi:ATP/maltotriose-dependent transcriptional regulator MalT/DNA-binding SARP family transcriptional activator